MARALAADMRIWTPGDPDCVAPADEVLDPILSAADIERIGWDDELQAADLMACLGSPWYWIVNHCVTLDEHDHDEPYKRFPPAPYLRAVADLWWWCGVRYPVLGLPKGRKLLATWLLSLFYFGDAQFKGGRRNMVQSYKLLESEAIIAKMRGVWQREPPWIRQPCEWTTTEARFANGSVFVAAPGGAEQLQGPTLSGYMMDEAGDHDEAQLTYEAALAACGIPQWRKVGKCGRFVIVGRCPRSWWHDVFLADEIGDVA